MHRKILLSGIAIAFSLGFAACERHEWEKTQKLHQPHGAHGAHDDHEGGDDAHHGGEEKHADGDAHKAEKGDAHQNDGHADKEKVEKAEPRQLGKE